MVYGALLARAKRLGLDEVSLYDVDEARLAQIAPVLEGLEQERGERAAVPRDAAARRGARGRRLRLLRDPRRPARGPRRRRAGAADEGVVGQETTGPGGICFALRTVPVMRELARGGRPPRAAGLVRQLHQPGRARHRGDPGHPRRPRRRHLRLAGRRSSAASPPRSAATADELWFDYFGLNHLGWLRGVHDGERDLLPGLLADDERLESFEEGAHLRRRVAALARDDPERVPVLPLLLLRHGRRDPVRARVARRVPAAPAGRRSTRRTAARPTRRSRPGARRGASARRTTSPRRTPPPGLPSRERVGGRRRLRGPGDRGRRGDRVQRAPRADPRTPRTAAACRSSTSAPSSRCRASSAAAGVVPFAVGDVPDHARALIEAIKAVERMTIEAALHRLARAGREGARAAPARAVREHRAAHLRRLRRPPAGAGGAVLVNRSTSYAPGMVFLDMTFEGLNELPENGRERWATRAARDARRRRDDRGRPHAARAPAGRGRAARARRPRAHAPRRARARRASICAGPEVERTPVTVVLPFAGDRAMVTYEPDGRRRPRGDRARSRRAPSSRTRRSSSSSRTASTATRRVGDSEAGSLAQHVPAELGRLRALLDERPGGAAHHGHDDSRGRGAVAREPRRDRRRQPRRGGRGRGLRRRARIGFRPRRSRPGTRRARAICSSPATSPGT